MQYLKAGICDKVFFFLGLNKPSPDLWRHQFLDMPEKNTEQNFFIYKGIQDFPTFKVGPLNEEVM
jgi:hypothetical protein